VGAVFARCDFGLLCLSCATIPRCSKIASPHKTCSPGSNALHCLHATSNRRCLPRDPDIDRPITLCFSLGQAKPMKPGRSPVVVAPSTFSNPPPSPPPPPPRSSNRPQAPQVVVSGAQPLIAEYLVSDSAQSTPKQSSTKSSSVQNSDPYAIPGADDGDVPNLPLLQVPPAFDEADQPISDDDPASYDLAAPLRTQKQAYPLEKQSRMLFSREHLQVIFSDPALLFKFTSFLSAHRPQSVPLLVYYLDALKAIRALHYANAICDGLDPIEGFDFTSQYPTPSVNSFLEQKANSAFDVLVKEELPAYITHLYTQVASLSITRRITGALAPHVEAPSDGLAEVFCLTDPSRPDNPIVFASEGEFFLGYGVGAAILMHCAEFSRTTQYSMGYVLGRNCRFLQGPWTNSLSVRRLRDAITAGRQQSEVFLN
jgi:hypothetical protein